MLMPRAQCNAERALTRAEALRVLAENVAGCPTPGFSTRSGEQLTGNPAIGAALARQIQTLLFYKEGKEDVGSWSGEQVAVQVETWGKQYTVNLLIGNDVLRVATSHSWMTKKQQ